MRPSLLLISHAYAALENRKKLQALAAHVDLVCVTSVIETHTVLGRSAADFDNESDASARRYELIRLPRLGRGITTFIYRGLGKVMRSRRFDAVLVENEPWAFVRWQSRLLAGLHQRGAVFGEFTWENVPRPGWKGMVLSLIYRAAAATTDFVIAGNQAAGRLFGITEPRLLVAPQIGVDLENHQHAGRYRLSGLQGCLSGRLGSGLQGLHHLPPERGDGIGAERGRGQARQGRKGST